ncbi:MAG: glycosyltransferase [bacterium]
MSMLDPWLPERWTISQAEMRTPLPKITIGILSYNRIDDLRRTLDCITRSVQYPDYEIIVVDNASDDGSAEMTRTEFPSVKIVAINQNIGTAGRNIFYKEARGKYVFSFDDDSFPATPATIYEVVSFLERRAEVDAVTLYYYQPLTGFVETGEIQRFRSGGSHENGFEGLFYAEGGMCIRTSSFLRISGYDDEFLVYGEGLDLTLQMYKCDMTLLYHPGFATLHMKSFSNRDNQRMVWRQSRNHIWTLAKHFPLYALLVLVGVLILRFGVSIALHPKRLMSYLKGILDGIAGIPAQRRKTRKLTLRQVLGLKRWYLFLYRW